jgi:secreted trypsin-like serine protease
MESAATVMGRRAKGIIRYGQGMLAAMVMVTSSNALAVNTEPALPSDVGEQSIVGGSSLGWPWLGALLYADEADPFYGQFCAGSLITPEWVLTAAHCLYGFKDDDYDVLFGSTVLYPGLGQRFAVEQIIVHEGYVADDAEPGVTYDNDIALIKLSESVDFIAPVKLAAPSFSIDELATGTVVSVMGWGATSYDEDEDESDDYPLALRSVDLPARSFAECLESLGEGEITYNMLCAGYEEGGKDTCAGDSGGPLAIENMVAGDQTQVGIVSWGLGCGLPGLYGVYTRVSQYADWITDNACEADDIPSLPSVELTIEGHSFQIVLGNDLPGTEFRLYYAFTANLDQIATIDLGTIDAIGLDVPDGISVKFMVQSYKGICSGGFSAVHDLDVASGS